MLLTCYSELKAYGDLDESESRKHRDSGNKRLLLFPHNGMSQSKMLID